MHISIFFFLNHPATTEIYTLSLHDALPISRRRRQRGTGVVRVDVDLQRGLVADDERSEEHTSELQSLRHLVCRLLLEKKKKKQNMLYLTKHAVKMCGDKTAMKNEPTSS